MQIVLNIFPGHTQPAGVLTFPLTPLCTLVCCQGESFGMFNLIDSDGSVFCSPYVYVLEFTRSSYCSGDVRIYLAYLTSLLYMLRQL
jgi:hypothetical protein